MFRIRTLDELSRLVFGEGYDSQNLWRNVSRYFQEVYDKEYKEKFEAKG